MCRHACRLKVRQRARPGEHQRRPLRFPGRLLARDAACLFARRLRRILLCLDGFAFPASCHDHEIDELTNRRIDDGLAGWPSSMPQGIRQFVNILFLTRRHPTNVREATASHNRRRRYHGRSLLSVSRRPPRGFARRSDPLRRTSSPIASSLPSSLWSSFREWSMRNARACEPAHPRRTVSSASAARQRHIHCSG